ncbi:4'-phosphopantetheinyl transferase family protein [Streptomyces sp. NPDC059688]|uniref:4'-phosphopantetheinyl transferase superfamily protein n=2 Tax=Streptomyces TaxID=1883 RepID=A0ABY6EYE0_9ACTN|nr:MULTISPECIES: 4'-phosphopantetheinyl transferase superfamily protein [unclassified Streptomyces]ATY69553.1 4'-phosphopantetheinyl transferase [Streptomyces sp. CB01883]UXY39418.1 4'-phosphopantetheinyl transferase superfamily protein [Streptomyces sp. HUAS 14-6]
MHSGTEADPPFRSRPPAPLPLRGGVTGAPLAHVWAVAPGTYGDLPLPSAGERRRLAAFRRDEDRLLYVTARGLLRAALSRCVPDVAPAHWRFTTGPHGRPEAAGPRTVPRLRFSVAHAPGLVVCLVCPELDCGVDVEVLDRPVDPVRVARAMFHPWETARVLAAPPAERAAVFPRLWTLKEAYGKARGLGFLLPSDSYAFTLHATGAPRLARAADDDGGRWQFAQWSPGARHVVAVAVRRGDGPDVTVVRHSGPP